MRKAVRVGRLDLDSGLLTLGQSDSPKKELHTGAIQCQSFY